MKSKLLSGSSKSSSFPTVSLIIVFLGTAYDLVTRTSGSLPSTPCDCRFYSFVCIISLPSLHGKAFLILLRSVQRTPPFGSLFLSPQVFLSMLRMPHFILVLISCILRFHVCLPSMDWDESLASKDCCTLTFVSFVISHWYVAPRVFNIRIKFD